MVKSPGSGKTLCFLARGPSSFVADSIGAGTFRVDMIDTWNMKAYFLGYTDGPVQTFQPGLLPA